MKLNTIKAEPFQRDMAKGTGEIALCWAVLRRAYFDLKGGDSKFTTEIGSRDLVKWVLDQRPEATAEPFSFVWIVNMIELPYSVVRLMQELALKEHQVRLNAETRRREATNINRASLCVA